VDPRHDLPFQLLLRARLDRETDLLIHRTAWVVGSQAFLFSAYAVSLSGPARAATAALAAKASLLVVVIPWVAVTSLLLLLVTIGAGVTAVIRLRRHTMQTDPRTRILDEGVGVNIASLTAPLMIPAAFLATWILLITES
jgi:phosphatidylglycerophosphatase A